MKIKTIILIILTSFLSNAQNEIKTEIIQVRTDINVDSKKLSINLSEGTWKVILYPIFQDNQIIKNSLPKSEGIYNLVINYDDKLFYIETILYKNKPTTDELEFYFYKENDRIFCKIKSDLVTELNKEIVMNKIENEMQNLINETKK